MKTNTNGCVLYAGPSAWDGEQIVVVLTGLTSKSENTKTADMLQTWILRKDRKPTAARQDGSDCSVCGDCPHRSGSCYVNLGQGPRAVWECYNRGGYLPYTPEIHDSLIAGRKVRIGSYGDPAMVPVESFLPILRLSSGHTGYTHQWGKTIGADYRTICMASADNADQAYDAESKGWRYFAVTAPGCEGPAGSYLCPASEEAGHRITCNNCGLCMGAKKSTVPSVFIPVHGSEIHKSIYNNKTLAIIG